MSGALLQTARKDAKKYVKNGGFEEDITLESPDSTKTVTLKGFVTKHWINFDTDGNAVNSKNAHICFDENDTDSLNYPIRNESEEVHLLRHKVSVKDSTGIVKNYMIIESFPDETLGLIVCILGDYGNN